VSPSPLFNVVLPHCGVGLRRPITYRLLPTASKFRGGAGKPQPTSYNRTRQANPSAQLLLYLGSQSGSKRCQTRPKTDEDDMEQTGDKQMS